MAYKGKRITNPANKQTIEFVTTSKESKGRLLEMIASWEPYSIKPMEHYHPYQDEQFDVLDGEMSLMLNGKTYILQKGDVVKIPAKTVHAMWNHSDNKAVMNWKVSPALHTEFFLETGMGLVADGKTGNNGMPGMLQTILLAQKYRKEFRLHQPNYILQRIVFAVLTPFALLSGKKAVYEKYID
jgi:mannose-6-phosphate isomerase-like protein (cupin superfamily)